MKYFLYILVMMVIMPITMADAQVAKISDAGTTVYSRDSEVYTPHYETQNMPESRYYNYYNAQQNTDNESYVSNEVRQQDVQDMQENPLLRLSRSTLKNTADQRTARNLLVLKEVSEYKLDDERLKDDITEVSQNKEYLRKIEIIRKKLSNKKISDSKNKEVLRILNDAGNKLYNLLSN